MSFFSSLLFFLTKPKSRRAKSNLSSIINKRAMEWNRDNPFDCIPSPFYNKQLWKVKDVDQHLAATIHSKFEAENFKAAICILCSDDVPAPPHDETLQALRDKHTRPALDRLSPCDPTGNTRFMPLQVSPYDIRQALCTGFIEGLMGSYPNALTTTQKVN